MGKFDGKQIIGVVGNIVFKKSRDNKITIVQSKAERVKQTENSKLTAGVFGNASALSRHMRGNLSVLFGKAYSGKMINALNTLNGEILGHCFDKETKTYTFQDDSFSRLKGFEFNSNSPLSKQLWVEPEITYADHKLRVSFPEIRINDDLKFLPQSNNCELYVAVAFYALKQALKKTEALQSFEVNTNEAVFPAKTLEFDVPEGCLCVVALGLQYTYVYENVRDRLNDLAFNPAGILGAIITPGTFVEPPQRIENNKSYAREWSKIDKVYL